MFNYIGSGRTDIVQLGAFHAIDDGPTTVIFKRPDGTEFSVETKAFQMLRRAALRESSNTSENKIVLIKAVRGLMGLSLRDAKEVSEYFMNNYSLDAGNSGYSN